MNHMRENVITALAVVTLSLASMRHIKMATGLFLGAHLFLRNATHTRDELARLFPRHK